MKKNVLIINSDLAKNRGDRAIAEGLIQLIRESYPDSHITGLSEQHERDSHWFGVDFLDTDVHTLNPLKWLALAVAAKRSDVVYWGGGELLKDYTNKAALWYWSLKIVWMRLFNARIYGAFQGIGPTKSNFSKRIIAFTVRRTKRFAVRDQESFDKLVSWGVPKAQLVSSSDPAILPVPEAITPGEFKELASQSIDEQYVNDFIAIAPRDWFHYKKGGIIPYKYKKRFTSERPNPQNELYKQKLVEMIQIAAKASSHVLLVPMHMSEDVPFCNSLKQQLPSNVTILETDTISPALLRKLLAQAKAMVGFRLHSNIIATSGYTPSVNFYYVDKGRVYFEQIGQQKNAFAIERVLEDDFAKVYTERLNDLLANQAAYRAELERSITERRVAIRKAFTELSHD